MKAATSIVFASLSGLTFAKPLSERQAQPSQEELCVGYDGDFGACQADFIACHGQGQDPNQINWDGIKECLANRRLSSTTPTAFRADIRVDTNRDGVIDMEGSSDSEGKDSWTETSGAIFLANIGDSAGRCKTIAASLDHYSGTRKLGRCHDAADDEQRAPQYMAPMRTVPIPGLDESATATVTVPDDEVRSLVRIFRPRSNAEEWEIVSNDTIFSVEEVRRGLSLGIDARDVRRFEGWDGRVEVLFTVKHGDITSSDKVMLRVAPVLLHHHRQPIQKLFGPDLTGSRLQDKAAIEDVLNRIQDSMRVAEVPGPMAGVPTNDVWTQDYFEPGYASMPGPNGTVVSLRVLLEGRLALYNSTRLVYTHLRGDGVAAIEPVRYESFLPADDDLQAGGNIEVIPPHEFNGKKYSSGRVVLGGNETNYAQVRDFLRAQEVQDAITLDIAFFGLQHVDQIVQFVPAKTERGWAMIAIDPQLGITLLREAQERGFGQEQVISAATDIEGVLRPTIDEFLATEINIQAAKESSRRMTANVELIKKETGIADADILRVPALVGNYYLVERHHRLPRYKEIRQDTNATFGFYLPSPVNGVPLSNSHYIAPKPFGPVINGRDMFETAAASVYEKVGFDTVEFLDGWGLHVARGDLHCLTNTFRDASEPWW